MRVRVVHHERSVPLGPDLAARLVPAGCATPGALAQAILALGERERAVHALAHHALATGTSLEVERDGAPRIVQGRRHEAIPEAEVATWACIADMRRCGFAVGLERSEHGARDILERIPEGGGAHFEGVRAIAALALACEGPDARIAIEP